MPKDYREKNLQNKQKLTKSKKSKAKQKVGRKCNIF